MKSWKKIAAFALSIGMVFALAACGGTGDGDADADANGGEKEKLIMATEATFPPYEYYEGGEVVGIDVDIATAIAEKLGRELQVEEMSFGSIISAVQSGKADIGMAGMTVDPDRLVSVNFSDSYATGYQVIIVKEGSDISSAEDLAGKKISVQENTTGDIYITDEFGDDAVDRYTKATEAVQALLQDKVDAMVIDREPAKVFVEQNEGLTILPTEYAVEDYAIAIAKDKEDLLASINQALAELTEDGTIQQILGQYISAE